ncbi:hypothetical protein KQR54_12855 [Mycobacterium gordonae]|uniref:hypothetical protein n=1 Tax=Mycobacterium gordonae TaxID=1778 RepID=UPI00210BA4B8|nr:hypothetical protein [Mycobacterium gordonae]MCQ4362017.1 hypothetical protein [Mycobacterium gordonae]
MRITRVRGERPSRSRRHVSDRRHRLGGMTSAVRDDYSGADFRRRASACSTRFPDPVRSGADVESSIRAALPRYRSVLEGAWTVHTAHPAYREQVGAGDPTGQCGVSSAWLIRQLGAEFGLQAMYCYGSLTIGDPIDVTIARHCWIEFICGAETFVIDVTADQAMGFDERIICGPKERLLSSQHLSYDARVRKSQQELVDDAVWPRLMALADGIADWHGSLRQA